jgi:pimeloyl-ACP methyl ester carboxylesterase
LIGVSVLLLCTGFARQAFCGTSKRDVGRVIHFQSGPYKLFGYYFAPKGTFNGSGIVLCPGSNNKGCSNILFPEICKRFAKLGYACLTFDFRGYGKSEGPAIVKAFKDLNFTEDAISAVTALEKIAPPMKKIVMIGHSMGGGVAVSAGVRDSRISQIVSISPGRRATELFLQKDAPRGLEWIRDRMYEDMTIKPSIPLSVLRKITLPIIIDSYRNFIFLKPILFIEGTYEDPKDIAFLTRYVQDIKDLNRKDHILLPSNHWIGTANGTKVVFPVAIHILVVTIDAWLRNDELRLADILRRVKHSKRLPVTAVRKK